MEEDRQRLSGEICKSCGRLVAETCPTFWHAPDALWLEVEGGPGGIRCIPCFTRDAAAKDISIQWWALRATTPEQDCWCTWDEIDGAEGIVRYHPRCPQHPASPVPADGDETELLLSDFLVWVDDQTGEPTQSRAEAAQFVVREFLQARRAARLSSTTGTP